MLAHRRPLRSRDWPLCAIARFTADYRRHGARVDHVYHEALNGFAGLDEPSGGQDCHGDGTHVAGVITGRMYGVAKQATVVSVRVLECDGTGTSSKVVAPWT